MIKRTIILAVLATILCMAPIFAKGIQEAEPANKESETSAESAAAVSAPEWLVENTADHITIIDLAGNEVTIQKPVKTLISNAMGEAFATIRALNAQDMVVASCEYALRNEAFFPVIAKLPSISMGQAVDNEMVIGLNPDLIISDPSFRKQFDEAIPSEIPLVQLRFDTEESIKLLGAILDKEVEAAEFIEWIKTYTDVVDERIATLSEEKFQDVFFYYGGQYGMSPPPPYGTFGKENLLRNNLIRRAGGNSLSQNVPGDWITVDPEWVIEQNPPLIIRECYLISEQPELGYGVDGNSMAKILMENILSQPAFESSDAVKNTSVYMIYGDLVNDSWFVSLVYLAKWFHPALFEDMDPVKMHQEYMTRFQRMDYDVTEQGLFVWPAE